MRGLTLRQVLAISAFRRARVGAGDLGPDGFDQEGTDPTKCTLLEADLNAAADDGDIEKMDAILEEMELLQCHNVPSGNPPEAPAPPPQGGGLPPEQSVAEKCAILQSMFEEEAQAFDSTGDSVHSDNMEKIGAELDALGCDIAPSPGGGGGGGGGGVLLPKKPKAPGGGGGFPGAPPVVTPGGAVAKKSGGGGAILVAGAAIGGLLIWKGMSG